MNFAKTIASFFLVLLLMPLGHAAMILMEHLMEPTALHFCAFAMGFVGLVIVIAGVFVKGDTRQTLFGLFGGLLFWTGWIEFLFAYFATRFGTHCDLLGSGIVESTTHYVDGIGVSQEYLINGTPLEDYTRMELKNIRGSRPEYLIMPATFGMWMMMMVLYLFCTRTGCRFMSWIQRHTGLTSEVELRPMARHASIVTFLELNMMLWSCYLVLMFCYDPVFLGASHPVTFGVAIGCLIGAIFMFIKELKIKAWGANIRMAIATVIVFWTFVEVIGRNHLLNEIWIHPLDYVAEMSILLGAFILLSAYLLIRSRRRVTKGDRSIL